MNTTRLGYACLNTELEGFKTITLKKYKTLSSEQQFEVLQLKTRQNFNNLYKIIKWNVKNNIKLYRVSSNLCPLYTHELCKYNFLNDNCIINLCEKIKCLALENNIRLTIHPSQYVVVNSVKDEVFKNAIKELQYHYELMQLLNIDTLCLHVGGKVNGIQEGQKRFIDNFYKLPKHLQNIICLENDDKSFNVKNTLEICEQLNIPMIIDLHHDRCLPSNNNFKYYLDRIIKTWEDKIPKCHLSSGKESDTDRKHAELICEKDFVYFYNIMNNKFDMMFECKNKEQSVLNFMSYIDK